MANDLDVKNEEALNSRGGGTGYTSDPNAGKGQSVWANISESFAAGNQAAGGIKSATAQGLATGPGKLFLSAANQLKKGNPLGAITSFGTGIATQVSNNNKATTASSHPNGAHAMDGTSPDNAPKSGLRAQSSVLHIGKDANERVGLPNVRDGGRRATLPAPKSFFAKFFAWLIHSPVTGRDSIALQPVPARNAGQADLPGDTNVASTSILGVMAPRSVRAD